MSIEIVLAAPLTADAALPVPGEHRWRAPPPRPVVGFVDNTKTGTPELFDALGRCLVRRGVPGSHFTLHKETAAFAITDEERATLLARAHVIVSGVGD